MESEPKPPPPRPIETWGYLALRSARGEYLKQASMWSVWTTPNPAHAETFSGAAELEKWREGRTAAFLRRLESDGFRPVRVELKVTELEPTAQTETRPMVAEAVCEP